MWSGDAADQASILLEAALEVLGALMGAQGSAPWRMETVITGCRVLGSGAAGALP